MRNRNNNVIDVEGEEVPIKEKMPQVSPINKLSLIIIIVIVLFGGWVWFFCRIEPGPDQLAVLIKKTGKDLPSGEIIAPGAEYKGIQLTILPPGRYFRNPYFWGWEIVPITDIPAGQVGVQTRLYGKDLENGKIIADTPETKGILAEVLTPGKYQINPYAIMVKKVPATTIKAGCVGVITWLEGLDPLKDQIPPEKRNTFLVEKGMKGVMAEVLEPGTYYLNPYICSVVEVNLQSQRFEMNGEDAISFLTLDGFTVTVEGTIEFAIKREYAALLTHRVGDMEDILKKVILPRARGFSRLEGSKSPAINYIVGETRQRFQNNLEQHLKEQCEEWGVSIRSILIRNIIAPEEIASIIRDREVAVQNAIKLEQQIEQARSKAELTRQETLAIQNKEKVAAETERIRAVIAAEQDMEVRLLAANKDLEVAKLENDAATFQVQAILAKAEADRDVIRLNNKAQAEVFAELIKAFGSGMTYARYTFNSKVGPRIQSILTTDDTQGFGALFAPLMPPASSK